MNLKLINELSTRAGRLVEELTATVQELPANMADGKANPLNKVTYDPKREVYIAFGATVGMSGATRLPCDEATALVAEINTALDPIRKKIEADVMKIVVATKA